MNKQVLISIQRTDNGVKEYAGGILETGVRILHDNDVSSRKIVLWIASENPFYLSEDVANAILGILQKTEKYGNDFEVKRYSAEITEESKQKFHKERMWKI